MANRPFVLAELPAEVKEYYEDQLAAINQKLFYIGKENPSFSIKVNAFYSDRTDLHAQIVHRKKSKEIDIGISPCYPVALHYYFNHLVQDYLISGVDEGIDNDVLERIKSQGLLIKFPGKRSFSLEIPSLIYDTLPKNEIQRNIAFHSASFALPFIGYHELCHLTSDHLDTDTSFSISKIFKDLRLSLAMKKDPLTMHKIWEYEADILASSLLIEDIFTEVNRDYVEMCDLDFDNIYHKASLVSTCIIAIFHLQHVSRARNQLHMSPLHRFIYILDHLINHIGHHFLVKDRQKLADTMFFSAQNVMKAWDRLNLDIQFDLEDRAKVRQTSEEGRIIASKSLRQRHLYKHRCYGTFVFNDQKVI
ncbi:hypothetical protein [Roseivirga spongicola]|mgnify:CR=1 FL=1|uniref:Uncharacterized protein n=1 Tax=Roseivirga spongicola TaxID=333140 RepID=A0A150XFQ5_9BACT|nr:hypothetical protein [Roseivirga spongicola]KYG77533.1 hypothetical protein AWW68_01815 [Roseivirga spongicola]WPZ11243.1 hypothetical protein T7867_03895 [Roseivirga spongicola]